MIKTSGACKTHTETLCWRVVGLIVVYVGPCLADVILDEMVQPMLDKQMLRKAGSNFQEMTVTLTLSGQMRRTCGDATTARNKVRRHGTIPICFHIFHFGLTCAKLRYEKKLFFPNSVSYNGVFSPDKLRCVPVRVAGAGSGGRFPKVPEGSRVCWCRFRRQVPASFRGVPVRAGVGRFWRVPACWCRFRSSSGIVCVGVGGSGGFRCVLVQEVLEGSGVCWCRFGFRRVPASSGVCWCRFRRQVPEGQEGSGRFAEGSGGFRCVLV